MALNATSTHHRTMEDELVDRQLVTDNYCNESWKDWPNEAGRRQPPTHQARLYSFVGFEEHKGPLDLQVKGSIPAWAAGALYRTGPGVSAIENTRRGTHSVSHWFDGFAHTHKFDIVSTEVGATTVTYSSRRQAEEFVENIKKKGWRTGISFAQKSEPYVGMFAKAMSFFAPLRVNNNVAVYRNMTGLASKAPSGSGHRTGSNNVFLTTDQSNFQDIDPDTLDPLGSTDQSRLHPDLKGPLSCAHAQRDEKTRDMFNSNLQPGRSGTYRIFRTNASTKSTDILATVSGPGICPTIFRPSRGGVPTHMGTVVVYITGTFVPLTWAVVKANRLSTTLHCDSISPAYIHSFFLTENYVILCIPSSHFGWDGAKILWERNLVEAIKPFDKSNLCRWIVIDRRHGKGVIARFSTPAGFFFGSSPWSLSSADRKRVPVFTGSLNIKVAL